ncbi:hypothetical protein EDB19DRAFT_1835837 [Suillus lakei]|nr:hypothetical protein EDB19DRAFT_1835837 [Suillus lakei]
MTGDYLEILLEREGPPPDWVCCVCDEDGAQKCHDCLAELMSCTRCCRTQHAQLPFHQISQWNRDFFERTTLMKVGVEIHIGHGGRPCPDHHWDWEDTDDGGPSAAFSTAGTPGAHGAGDNDGEGSPGTAHPEVPEDHDDMGEGDMFLDDESPASTNNPPVAGQTHIMVVHMLGVHMIITGQAAVQNGTLPALIRLPKDGFHILLLDNFILDNLECGTSAMNYYSKLRCITSSMFPHLVPGVDESGQTIVSVKASEMEWLWSQQEGPKRWGAGSFLSSMSPTRHQCNPTNGSRRHEAWCGYNKSAEEQENVGSCCLAAMSRETSKCKHKLRKGWLYSQLLVMDGNFKAKHLHPTHLEDKVWLTDGKSFMVARARYQAHLALAKDSAQRQMNMDYTLCNALAHNTDGLHWALTFYDVNCQYNKHLCQWVDESLHLGIPSGMDIVPGIGLWHVHGHQDKCYVRYTSNFIPGAARIDGEVMETLWAPLNIISPSTRGMSTPHRQECLDYQMNDCNFMKMIWIGLFLSWKYKEAKCRFAESTEVFDSLNDAADPEMVKRWEAQERHAQASQVKDPSALDIYDIQLQKVRTQKEVEVELLQASFRCAGARHQLGAAAWIHSIDKFVALAGRYLGEGYDADDRIPDMNMGFLQDGPDSGGSSDEDSGNVQVQAGDCPRALFRPEIVIILLPSNLGMERCEQLGTVEVHPHHHQYLYTYGSPLNPVKLDIDIIRYNEALTKRESGMNDTQEKALLARFPPPKKLLLNHPSSIAKGESGNWRSWGSNFLPPEGPKLTPGCINIAPCWFQQGHECYGPPPENPDDGFKPVVSASLKGNRSLSMILDMQRHALIVSAALHVMHPQLYWASVRTHLELGHWSVDYGLDDMHHFLKHWASVYTGAAIMCNHQTPDHRDPKCPPKAFDILTCIRSYQHAVMQLINFGIELDPDVKFTWAQLLGLHHHPGPEHQFLHHCMGLAVTSTSLPWAQTSKSLPSYGPRHHFYITTLGPNVKICTIIWARTSNSIPSYGPNRHFYITTLCLVIKICTIIWARLSNSTSPPWAQSSKSVPSYGPRRQTLHHHPVPGQQNLYHHMGPDVKLYITTLGLDIKLYTIIWARLSLLHHHPWPGHQNPYHHMGLTIRSTSPPWAQMSNSTPSCGPGHQFYIITLGLVIKLYTIMWAQPSLLYHHPGPSHQNLYHHMGPTVTSTPPPWAWSSNSTSSCGPNRWVYITTLGLVIQFHTITLGPTINFLHHHMGPTVTIPWAQPSHHHTLSCHPWAGPSISKLLNIMGPLNLEIKGLCLLGALVDDGSLIVLFLGLLMLEFYVMLVMISIHLGNIVLQGSSLHSVDIAHAITSMHFKRLDFCEGLCMMPGLWVDEDAEGDNVDDVLWWLWCIKGTVIDGAISDIFLWWPKLLTWLVIHGIFVSKSMATKMTKGRGFNGGDIDGDPM